MDPAPAPRTPLTPRTSLTPRTALTPRLLPPTRRGRLRASLLAIAAAAALVVVGLVVPTASADTACAPGQNAIVCENAKPGTDPSVWDITGAGDPSIQGYSTDISVNVGQRIDFKIDTDAAAYSIDVYRTGWYAGKGARLITSVTPSAALPQVQPECLSDVTAELYDCGTWAVSAGWDVPSTAVSGVYVALLTRADTGGRSQITFVVRDTASTSAVLFQTSDPTWQAYNTFGGSNFYSGGANGRAYKLSYNRPVTTRGDNQGRDFYFANEFPLVRFLERNGYDVSYFSGVDTDRFGSALKQHRTFLSVGHDEYWSGAQRANVTAARDAGVNLQFLSGNENYWRTRYEPSPTAGGKDYRTVVTYKETWANAKTDPSPESTGTWRDPRFASVANGGGRPENSLAGTLYMVNYSDLPVTVSAAEGKLRLWRNTSLTGLAAGSSAALAPHTIGYESNEDVDNGARPPGLIRLSTTTGAVPEYLQDFGTTVAAGTTRHNLTLYKAASGALVFSAGSVQWTWGLDQQHDGNGAAADVRMQQAQVNLFADMGVQPTTLMSGLVAATKSTDTAGPTVAVSNPSGATSKANGSTVSVSGTATDAAGKVAGVEVSTDGATWHPATGTTSWSYSYVQHGAGTGSIRVRAVDDSANIGAVTSRAVTITGTATVFGAEVPKTADSGDVDPATLGLRFTPSADGFIQGVRFYKSAANTGPHTGTLWSVDGRQLATVAFANETASGWQTATFGAPVAVNAGTTYVVSYTTTTGHYSAADWFWSSTGYAAAPLTVAGGFGATPAGVYSTTGGFPTDSYRANNYYVDAVYSTVDATPLSVGSQSPLAGSSSVAPSTKVSAVFSKAVTASTVAMTLKTAAGASVAGSTAYNATTRTATFTPTAPLAASTGYTATLAGTATGGGTVTAGGSWTFTTQAPDTVAGACPCRLFDDSTTPGIAQVAEGTPVTLGTRFAPLVDGTITSLRFYKGPGNTGTHVGTLSNADTGAEIGRATFTAESTAGWQQVTFATPVAVTGGTDYVAAYTTTTGNYSATINGFGSGSTRGPLVTASDSGAYTYSGGFAGQRSTTNYLVDVSFTPSAAPTPTPTPTPVTPSGTRLFADATPATASAEDSSSVEVGMAFTASTAGSATGIAFYKGSRNTGTHVGSLWDASGTRIAQVTFTGETATGWQSAAFATPVELVPGARYTVSYLAPAGYYAATGAGLASPVTNGALTSASGDNGVYRYGSGGVMPSSSYNSTNYFVDVYFQAKG
ncbi:Ig-like domain-containing protein [Rathayibacter sp. PhB93]|uniref:DUF4082 domain-containing protein n=1 Tax=unclassified Rathayibacter TaxID=2609250 RepID=UPI000F488D43|nr:MULTISPECIES: DUF4082 domain-containing protein [unclassified Rathayibacter]ROQ03697.1 Ig-like domain-containing protein [Rathayibacter sp. PhB93]TDQ10721.1 Ig-like domain-containing protein [Rathayibacter sp. PhB1]